MINKAATNETHTLFVGYDEDPINPREDYDNFGKMICFHRRYILGDKHSYDDPRDFLKDLLDQPQFIQPVFDFIKSGNASGVKLEYDRRVNEWHLLTCSGINREWYVCEVFAPGLKRTAIPDTFMDAALPVLSNSEMLDILNFSEGCVILPLFLYDHGGITMRTSPFSCPWDSGQVGWTYADHDMIQKEYGEVTKETIEKAQSLLEAKVECYDLYLTGQCYGFRLFEGEAEIDSCWGFLGEYDDFIKEVCCYLPEECRHLVDALVDCSENSEAEYFWRRRHAG